MKEPSKPTKPINLYGLLGILISVIAAGIYVNPFDLKSLFGGLFSNVSTDSGLDSGLETFVAKYQNGCPVHRFIP